MKEFYRRCNQIVLLIKYLIAKFISSFYPSKRIFLICERGTDARDNGFCFFEFVKRNHPEIEAYYIITSDSPDRKKLNIYGDSIVSYQSFRNMVIYCRATDLISTHIHGYHPEVSLFNRLDKWFGITKNKKCVSLKHGITKDFISGLLYSETKLDLLVCGAKPEFIYMKENFGYPEGVLQYTGFCRFDKLHNYHTKNQILVMPTWRQWISKENFLDSDFFRAYKSLLQNKKIDKMLNDNKMELVFYPHHEMQPFINHFKHMNLSRNIIIADKYSFDVQMLLKDSKILITDYSSVFFDFAYMHKPIIFYQFDKEEYRKKHYSEGYFKYEDSFGPVTESVEGIVRELDIIISNGCVMKSNYLKRVNDYFPLCDRNNCERVYNCII